MRRTKIICTIGPKTSSYEALEKLAKGGMNVARLNMSHGDHKWHKEVIKNVKKINKMGHYCISIMLDTKGPEVRSGDLKKEIELKKGDQFTFTTKTQPEYEHLTTEVSYDGFIDEVKIGDIILVDGGILSMKAIGKTETDVICECLDNGKMTSRRHLNVRGKSTQLPSITKKDWQDIDFGVKEGVDFFALSFVKEAKSVKKLKKYLEKKKSTIGVLAKIESISALPNLEEIIESSDGAMVARGDLGSEIPIEDVPLVQEKIIRICRHHGKPVIVATHLLESMIIHPTPTRAEVTDIAHAVFQYTDALMLSGETAAGNHPHKSLSIMDRVSQRIEEKLMESNEINVEAEGVKESMVMSASLMANNLEGSAIIVITKHGHMANLLSRCRPNPPIFALTSSTDVQRKLTLNWGVESFCIKFSRDPEKTIQKAIALLKKEKKIEKNEKVVIVSDILASHELVETIQIRIIK